VKHPFGAIVVDGYVDLDAHGAPGLGAHLYDALEGRVPVIGIAKTAYKGADFAAAVVRGESTRPVYVTSRGVPLPEAAERVRGMHGPHRIPTLVTRVDHLARGYAQPMPPS
jgi:deoxyribonuclease V